MADTPSPAPAYVFDDEGVKWDDYTHFRPEYPAELYDLIYKHHAEVGNNSWARAADLGCGGGLVASKLISRFDHVIASDPMKQYIETAEQNLSEPATQRRVSFLQAKAEELAQVPDQSLDMITMAMAIHWSDYQAVVRRAAELLRPGGTFAVWIYSTRAYFLDNAEADAVMDEINDIWTTATYAIVGPRSPELFDSKLHCLDFRGESWSPGVQRHVWLSERTFTVENHPPAPTMTGKEDVVENHRGEGSLLTQKADLDWTKGYMHSLLPKHNINERLVKQYDRLDEALASTGGSATLGWPVALVMATRK